MNTKINGAVNGAANNAYLLIISRMSMVAITVMMPIGLWVGKAYLDNQHRTLEELIKRSSLNSSNISVLTERLANQSLVILDRTENRYTSVDAARDIRRMDEINGIQDGRLNRIEDGH